MSSIDEGAGTGGPQQPPSGGTPPLEGAPTGAPTAPAPPAPAEAAPAPTGPAAAAGDTPPATPTTPPAGVQPGLGGAVPPGPGYGPPPGPGYGPASAPGYGPTPGPGPGWGWPQPWPQPWAAAPGAPGAPGGPQLAAPQGPPIPPTAETPPVGAADPGSPGSVPPWGWGPYPPGAGAPQPPPPAPRKASRLRAPWVIVAGVAAAVLVCLGVGVVIGYGVWGTTSTPAASVGPLGRLPYRTQIPPSTTIRGGFLGVEVTTGSTPSGARVVYVMPTSPAANAGIASGDTITAVGSTSVGSPAALRKAVESHSPGQKVKIIWSTSTGKKQTATVTLADPPNGN